ncbi:MAG: CerR family C-terminal domain-containing protein [Gammaproteobacteria bacterium]|nr:CerR family C-terminal domain-containing protein [Gammaproteobacteria bacterium]
MVSLQDQKSVHSDTRTRLLKAALKVFSQRDFDAASVRDIVQRADANVAAVSYHFGSKQGLYLATAEFLADALLARMGPMLAEIRNESADTDAAAAETLLRRLIHGLSDTLLSDGIGDDAAGFVLREQHQPTAAFDILYERLMAPMQQGFARLVARIDPTIDDDSRTGILVTHALIGQILAFRMARSTVLRRLGQPAFSATDVARIAALTGDLTCKALHNDNHRKPTE